MHAVGILLVLKSRRKILPLDYRQVFLDERTTARFPNSPSPSGTLQKYIAPLGLNGLGDIWDYDDL